MPEIQRTNLDPARLHSSFVPSDSDMNESRTLLLDADANIQRFDDKIARLQSTLASLKFHRDLRERDRNSYKALGSLFRRIPFEIWTQIFALSMGAGQPGDRLAEVCVRWRQTLLAAPFLWCDIEIELTEMKRKSLAPFLQSCKRYCGDVTLHVWLEVIVPLKGRSSQLTSFAITIDGDGPGLVTDDYTSALDVLSVALRLSHLNLSNICLSEGSDPPAVLSSLWKQLNNVQLDNSSLWFAHQVLACAPNLTTVSFKGMDYQTLPAIQDICTVLSKKISHLSISELTIGSILTVISIPSLTSVHLRAGFYGWHVTIDDFVPFLHRLACILQTLLIDNTILDDRTLLDILSEVPQLRVLTLIPYLPFMETSPIQISNEIYQRMTFTNGLGNSKPLVPHLQSLTVSAHPGAVMDALLDMVLSRSSNSPEKSILSHCEVRLVPDVWFQTLPSDAVSSFYARIDAIRAQGMRIRAAVGLNAEQ
ncbi:hypothetical protein C8J56DRAFT_889319 [Mycena floridula]|nr:hypothetical protein C8J56DRAFT_889319 [Mycena floridula]